MRCFIIQVSRVEMKSMLEKRYFVWICKYNKFLMHTVWTFIKIISIPDEEHLCETLVGSTTS